MNQEVRSRNDAFAWVQDITICWWMSTGTVTDAEIRFGSGPVRWRIDRNSAEADLVNAAGKVVFMGSCVAAGKP